MNAPKTGSKSSIAPGQKIQDRGWFNLFFPLLGEGNKDKLLELREEASRISRHPEKLNSWIESLSNNSVSDRYVVPFALIIDSTLVFSGESASLGLSDRWFQGPLPFEYFARDEEVKAWLTKTINDWPLGGRSDACNRQNHFSRRASEKLYGDKYRHHVVLERPISVARDLDMNVSDGISIWAFELLLSPKFNFEKTNEIVDRACSAELVCHFEATLKNDDEVDIREALSILHKDVRQALRVLSRKQGKFSDASFRINPVTGFSANTSCEPEVRKIGSSRSQKEGRTLFHSALIGQLKLEGLFDEAVLLPDAFETPEFAVQAKKHLSHCPPECSSDVSLVAGSMERRSFSITIFPVVENEIDGGLGDRHGRLSGAFAAGASEQQWKALKRGLMLNGLISGDPTVTEERIERAKKEPRAISEHIHYLSLRDGISYVVDSIANPYNTAVLAYTFGVRLDQFLIGRMTSRLFEQLGIAAGQKFDWIRGYEVQGKPSKKRSDIQRSLDVVRLLDEDIAKVKGIYWQASSTASARSNRLLKGYRENHEDQEALDLLEEKREDLQRVVRANSEAVDRAINNSTSGFYRFLAGLTFAVIVSTQVVEYSGFSNWSFWGYFSLWLGLTVVFGVIAAGVLSLIDRWALAAHFDHEAD